MAALPLGLILAYGGARVASLAFWRVARRHLCKLSARAPSVLPSRWRPSATCTSSALRFHLDRQTGGLIAGLIERGTKAIDIRCCG